MSIFINAFIEYLSFEKNYSKHTIEAYKRDLNQFSTLIFDNGDEINAEKLENISRYDFKKWQLHLVEKKLSSKTLQRKIASIRSFFRFLTRKAYIQHDPTLKIIRPRAEKKVPQIVAENKIAHALDQLHEQLKFSKETLSELLYTLEVQKVCIMELLYSCGLRVSELCFLSLPDIQKNRRQLRVTGKGKKQRIVPVGSKAWQCLELFMQKRPLLLKNKEGSNALFLSPRGQRLYPRYVQLEIKKCFPNIAEIHPHLLRHSYATHMLNNGAELVAIKELMGHANLAATQIYTQTNIERLKQAYTLAHPRSEQNESK